jgi:hypothetical protein
MMKIFPTKELAALVVLLLFCMGAAVETEPRTGISFPSKMKRVPLNKLGVRYKLPFGLGPVYAVGQYGSSIFLLKMVIDVNADKVALTLVEALKSRCKQLRPTNTLPYKGCESKDIADLGLVLLKSLPKGASKGTEILFRTGGGKLTISVNNISLGSIMSPPVARAFNNIFTGKNPVCQMKIVYNGKERQSFTKIALNILIVLVLTIAMLYFASAAPKQAKTNGSVDPESLFW